MGRGIQSKVSWWINPVACKLERRSSLKVMIEYRMEMSTEVLVLSAACNWLLSLMVDCKLVRCKCKTFSLSSFYTLLAL